MWKPYKYEKNPDEKWKQGIPWQSGYPVNPGQQESHVGNPWYPIAHWSHLSPITFFWQVQVPFFSWHSIPLAPVTLHMHSIIRNCLYSWTTCKFTKNITLNIWEVVITRCRFLTIDSRNIFFTKTFARFSIKTCWFCARTITFTSWSIIQD